MAAKYPDMEDLSLSRAEKMGLNCPVCLEVYKEPKSLSCLHTFCETCIHSYLMKMKENGTLKDDIECPLCRKTTVTEVKNSPPEEWTASLPNNYAIQSVLDAVNSRDEDKNENTPRCQPCQKIDKTMVATKYCSNCQEYQCEECVKNHKRYAGMTGHDLIEVEACLNMSLKLSTDFGKLDQCDAHAKPIEYYCVDDNKLCCSACAIIVHRKCENVVEIQEMAEKVDSKNTLKTKLIELREKLKLASNHFQQCDQEIEGQISALPEKLENVRAKFNKMLDDLKEKVMNEAAVMKKNKSAELNEAHTECESLVVSLEATLCTHEDVVNNGTSVQLYIARHKIEEHMSVYEQKAEEQLTKLQSFNINICIGEHIEEVLASEREVGSLSMISKSLDIHSIMECQPVKLEMISSIDVIQAADDEFEPLVSGMKYLSDGRLVLVDNKNNRCLIIDKELTTVGKINLQYKPIDVIVISDFEIAIAGSMQTHIFQVNINNTLTHIQMVKTESTCGSISLIDENNFAIGKFKSGKKPACIVSRSGEEKEFGVQFPTKLHSYTGSLKCNYSRQNKKLIISVRDRNIVYMFDTVNNDTVAVNDERLQGPEGIAFGKLGCVFVCSKMTNSVVNISPSGKVINVCKLPLMESPHVICISQDETKLAVSNRVRKERKVQVYELSNICT